MLSLTAKISFFSLESRHPDEKYHLLAARYYVDHSLPPNSYSEEILETYSKEGYSRLNDLDTSYWLAGKTARLLLTLGFKDQVSIYRTFNLLLLLVILLRIVFLAIKNNPRFILYSLLFCSCQLWYVFGYVNDDALPLFLSFVMMEGVVQIRTDYRYLIGTGIVFGLLFLSKTNFFVSIFFFGTLLMYEFYKSRNWKLSMVPVVAAVVIFLRYGLDIMINGFNRSERLMEMVSKTAWESYRIPQLFGETFMMKSQGVSVKEILFKYHWLETTLKSSFGVFGNMTIFLSDWYYTSLIVAFLLLSCWFLFRIYKSSGLASGSLVAMLALGATILMFTLSFYYSWSFDFQAQGRYLFPVVSVLGYVAFNYRDTVNHQIRVLVGLMSVGAIIAMAWITIIDPSHLF